MDYPAQSGASKSMTEKDEVPLRSTLSGYSNYAKGNWVFKKDEIESILTLFA